MVKPAFATKRERELFTKLAHLCASTRTALAEIDAAMAKAPEAERGKKVAAICNALEMVNDQVRYFTLGIDYRKDKPLGVRQ